MSKTFWIIITVSAIAGACGMGFWLRCMHKKLEGFQAPQLRFRYRGAELTEELKQLAPEKARLLTRFSLLFVLMLIFAGLCMAVVAHNAAHIAVIRYIMYGLTAAACGFGFLETLLLAAKARFAKAASVCSLIKWVLFGVWVALMFISLFITSTAL